MPPPNNSIIYQVYDVKVFNYVEKMCRRRSSLEIYAVLKDPQIEMLTDESMN